MNTPRPPMEPLDAQEREFARILGALPGGEPPAALDAAILRAAANAAAASKRPAARLLASAGAMWGIGSAAAAVLALGVAWQLRYGGPQAPAAASAPSAQMVSERAEDEAVQVELDTQAADAPFVPPPPPPKEGLAAKPAPAPAQLRRQRQEQPARDAAPAAAAAPAAEPEAFAADQLDEHVAREAAATANAAEGARAEAELEYKGRSEESASKLAAKRANAPPPPPAPVTAAAPAAPPPEAQSRSDTGSSAALGQAGAGSALGGLADSDRAQETRKPATWLAEIRKLRDQGRLQEARAALVEFRKKYPKWVIPTDLAPLLSE